MRKIFQFNDHLTRHIIRYKDGSFEGKKIVFEKYTFEEDLLDKICLKDKNGSFEGNECSSEGEATQAQREVILLSLSSFCPIDHFHFLVSVQLITFTFLFLCLNTSLSKFISSYLFLLIFLASPDALEVIVGLTDLLIVSTDLTNVTDVLSILITDQMPSPPRASLDSV